jgi:hypothetical protein
MLGAGARAQRANRSAARRHEARARCAPALVPLLASFLAASAATAWTLRVPACRPEAAWARGWGEDAGSGDTALRVWLPAGTTGLGGVKSSSQLRPP